MSVVSFLRRPSVPNPKYLHGEAELLDDNETAKVQGFPGRVLLSARQFELSELVFVNCQQGRRYKI